MRSSPTPPPPQGAAVRDTPVTCSDIVVYMHEYAHVRQQALLLLKQLLVSDDFATGVRECVTGFGAGLNSLVAPPMPSPTAGGTPVHTSPAHHAHSLSQSSATGVIASSWEASTLAASGSWSSACFWQLCMDEVLFPLLRDLAASAPAAHLAPALAQPLFLESSPSVTLVRTLGVNLLAKVFLRHLSELHAFSPVSGFTRCWLQVLKVLDRFLQMGVSLQRNQTRALQAAHTAAGQQVASSVGKQASGSGLSSAGVPLALHPIAGVEWSGESGLQLTESVAEALTNLVLVMKDQGIFGPTTTTQQPTAASAGAPGQPTSELWELTVAILQPWIPFIPALADSVLPPSEQPQPQPPLAERTEGNGTAAAFPAASPSIAAAAPLVVSAAVDQREATAL